MASGSGIEYKLEGIDQTINFFEGLTKQMQDTIDDIMNANAEDIAGMAKELVPTPAEINQGPNEGGLLKSSIKANVTAYLTKEVEAGAHYAAYVEFGTRPLVIVPTPLQAYAMQFIGAGPPDVPTKANAYLYPSFVKYIPLFIETAKGAINRMQPPKAT